MNRHAREVGRYVINGIVATAVHYGILTVNIEFVGITSAGLASFIAAIFGITTSFLGSRYYVFRNTSENIFSQAAKFSGLYGTIAILHGLVLLIWTDFYAFNYRTGFLIATGLQVSLSYLVNKFLVFKT
jgi:putative flippase GtrA